MRNADLLILGGGGMLGRQLVVACRRHGHNAVALAGRSNLDITDGAAVLRRLDEQRPRVVINAAGYTDVDRAETEPEAADRANRAGPGHLAEACRRAGALLVHYSTDYVFDGRSATPYGVGDAPGPVNTYGRTKLAGEQAVAGSGCRHLLLRTSWLFAARGRNFVRTIIGAARRRPELSVVDDQLGRPTGAADLAEMTLDLVERGAEGIFHVTNAGQSTWYELARATVERAGLACEVRPCPTAAAPRPAPRPSYSVLDYSATAGMIGEPRHWSEALAECIGDRR